MKVKEKSEKVGLKLNIQKTKIMASSPITSWQIDGETNSGNSVRLFWGGFPCRLPGEISKTSDMQMTPPLWQKVKRN